MLAGAGSGAGGGRGNKRSSTCSGTSSGGQCSSWPTPQIPKPQLTGSRRGGSSGGGRARSRLLSAALVGRGSHRGDGHGRHGAAHKQGLVVCGVARCRGGEVCVAQLQLCRLLLLTAARLGGGQRRAGTSPAMRITACHTSSAIHSLPHVICHPTRQQQSSPAGPSEAAPNWLAAGAAAGAGLAATAAGAGLAASGSGAGAGLGTAAASKG